MNFIKFNVPNKHTFDSQEVKKLYSQNNFIKNKYYQLCHKKISNIISSDKEILLTNSCSSSLEIIALFIKDHKKYKKNSNIIMPSYTFSSTANAFIKFGFKVKFIDINQNDFMVDPFELELKVDKNTLGFVNITYGSHVNNLTHLSKICKKYDIFFIEDAAQSFGAKYDGKNVGTFGNFGCYSFHQTKNFHCGFGGALVVDKKSYKKCSMILDRGTNREFIINANNNNKYYEWTTVGGSYGNSEFNFFFLNKDLDNISKNIAYRKKIYESYFNFFKKYESFIHLIDVQNNITSNYHSFWIRFYKHNLSKKFISFMYEQGIECFIGYVPLHKSKFYSKKYKKLFLKNTDLYARSIVRLPMHTYLRKKDLLEIFKYSKIFFENQ